MTSTITILDGGMGRQLKASGAPFRQPEWSALALIEGPQHVLAAHEAFLEAGADVITTNSYALVPFHIGEERFAADGERLADLAGRLAAMAKEQATRPVRVAASLPPLFGSYRPDLFRPEAAPGLLDRLVKGLTPHADIWLGETLSLIAEAEAVRAALKDDPRPLWLSFTLKDDHVDPSSPRLRSGETVQEAAVAAERLGAEALLFNCSQPEVMDEAVRQASAALEGRLRVGVYANAFETQTTARAANEGESGLRDDLGEDAYLARAREWVRGGASIVGGCCGIGPEHIAALRRELRM